MHVPNSYSQPFRKKFSQFEDTIGTYKGPKVQNPIAAFAGMMTKLDEDVGRLVDLLDELGIRENTLIMLTSDNGPHQEGGHNPRFFDSNGPFRGFKRDLYEGGIRVPMIANWPGKIAEGSITDHISAHWDVWPTVCELIGEDAGVTDGISFLPTLLGKGEQPKHEYLYWEFFERGGRQAIRMGDWKAVVYGVKKKANPKIQLFNLKEDPGETNDVAAQNPDLVAKAKQQMNDAHTRSHYPKWRFPADKLADPIVNNTTRSLFDGKTLEFWDPTNFGGEGECQVENGLIRIEAGDPLSGLTYNKDDLPKINYEFSMEAKRLDGVDFFGSVTFPYKDNHCSLIVGGWAGSTVGLSNVDGKDASSNETKRLLSFEGRPLVQDPDSLRRE